MYDLILVTPVDRLDELVDVAADFIGRRTVGQFLQELQHVLRSATHLFSDRAVSVNVKTFSKVLQRTFFQWGPVLIILDPDWGARGDAALRWREYSVKIKNYHEINTWLDTLATQWGIPLFTNSIVHMLPWWYFFMPNWVVSTRWNTLSPDRAEERSVM